MDYNRYYTILNKNVFKITEVLRNKSLYFSQISEQTGIKSKNNLLKNLDSLTSFKILNKDKGKGNTFYSINYNNAFAISILNLIDLAKFQSLPFERRKAIEETLNKLKPALAILFGSTAKGNFKPESDIDLLLVYNKKPKIDNEIKEIASRYGVKINAIIMDFNEFDTRNESIKHVIKTGYPLTGEIYFYEAFKNV